VLAVFECRNVELVEWKYEEGISAIGKIRMGFIGK
jgi:hypothetical protein